MNSAPPRLHACVCTLREGVCFDVGISAAGFGPGPGPVQWAGWLQLESGRKKFFHPCQERLNFQAHGQLESINVVFSCGELSRRYIKTERHIFGSL